MVLRKTSEGLQFIFQVAQNFCTVLYLPTHKYHLGQGIFLAFSCLIFFFLNVICFLRFQTKTKRTYASTLLTFFFFKLAPSVLCSTAKSADCGLSPAGPPTVGPRSYSGPLPTTYNVQFPLGRPTSENLQAICDYSDLRPRYPSSYFPDSGYGVDKLRASAVNNAEAWLSTCCKDNQTWEREVTLCCATQAVCFHNSSYS